MRIAYLYPMFLLVLTFCIVGCGHGAARTDASLRTTQQVILARRCPELADAHVGREGPFERVFIEAADVTHSDLPQPEGTWPKDYSMEAEVIQVAGALAENDKHTTIPWGGCDRRKPCADRQSGHVGQWALEFTPHLPDRKSGIIKLSGLRLSKEGRPHADFSGVGVASHDQRPVIIELPRPGEQGVARVAITPYLVSSDADLGMLFECRKGSRG